MKVLFYLFVAIKKPARFLRQFLLFLHMLLFYRTLHLSLNLKYGVLLVQLIGFCKLRDNGSHAVNVFQFRNWLEACNVKGHILS